MNLTKKEYAVSRETLEKCLAVFGQYNKHKDIHDASIAEAYEKLKKEISQTEWICKNCKQEMIKCKDCKSYEMVNKSMVCLNIKVNESYNENTQGDSLITFHPRSEFGCIHGPGKDRMDKRNKVTTITTEEQKELQGIIERRLLNAPDEITRLFPPVLSTNCAFYASVEPDSHLLVTFLSKYDLNRVNDLVQEDINPFPGLVRAKDSNQLSAFKLNTQNAILENECIAYKPTFTLKPNSSCIITNLFQSVNTKQKGVLSYHLQLGYLLSFGSMICESNMLNYLDATIAYSVKYWRNGN